MILTSLIPFLILLVILFVIVVGIELIARTTRVPLELTRKATHILVGVVVALSAHYVTHEYLLLLAVMFLVVIAVSRSRGVFRSIHDAERSGLGELWYPLGILLAAVLFPAPVVFMYAVLILAVSDGLAGLVGKFFGKRKISFLSTPKTYAGSGAFYVSASIMSLLVMPAPVALVTAAFLTVIELFSFRGLDNLILPLVAGVALTIFA